jgi:hypothetical protein
MTARNVLVVGAGAAGTATRGDADPSRIGLPHVSAFIADWVTGTFAAPPSPGG